MADLAAYCDTAIKLGAKDAKVISAREVFVEDWVRLKCEFGCGCYNTNLMCPPRSPDAEKTRRVLTYYDSAILIHCEKSADVRKVIPQLERLIFIDGFYRALGMACGPCYLCDECNLECCIYPDQARPAMEACSINVFRTARNAGFPIKVLRTRRERGNYYGLVLVE